MTDAARAALAEEVAALTPFDAREARDIETTLAWIASGAELYRRAKPATPPMHLVCYFLLVDGPHVLLCDHLLAGLWLPTGGHVDPGEHPRETVRREAQEELAITAEFLRPTPHFLTVQDTVGAPETRHTDVTIWYLLQGDRAQP